MMKTLELLPQPDDDSSNSSPDHCLEMIRLVKAEFIKEMDVRLERMSC